MTAETAEKLGLAEDLRPDRQGQGPDALRQPRVPPARGLPARSRARTGWSSRSSRRSRSTCATRSSKKGQADVSIVFTTDPQIKRDGEVLLEDDKGMFPPYNSTLVVRNDVVEKAGEDLPGVIAKATEGPDRRGDAGAQRPRRPRQADARGGRRRVPQGERARQLSALPPGGRPRSCGRPLPGALRPAATPPRSRSGRPRRRCRSPRVGRRAPASGPSRPPAARRADRRSGRGRGGRAACAWLRFAARSRARRLSAEWPQPIVARRTRRRCTGSRAAAGRRRWPASSRRSIPARASSSGPMSAGSWSGM